MVTKMMVRDMDLAAPNPNDSRRLEIVIDRLPLFCGAQLAIDTTLESVLHCDGSARARVAHVDGAEVQVARRRKERTYPELVGQRALTRLVLAGEVGVDPARPGALCASSRRPRQDRCPLSSVALSRPCSHAPRQGFCGIPP